MIQTVHCQVKQKSFYKEKSAEAVTVTVKFSNMRKDFAAHCDI